MTGMSNSKTATASGQSALPGTRTVLHEALTPLGTMQVTTLVPQDLALIYGWTRGEYARFWGMQEHTLEEVSEIYTFLATSTTHRAYVMHLSATPCGIVQTYEPSADPVGDAYPVRRGDKGMHFLVAPPGQRPSGLAGVLARECIAWIFADSSVRRIVIEPDERNVASLAMWRASGFEFAQRVQLPGKVAHLGFLRQS